MKRTSVSCGVAFALAFSFTHHVFADTGAPPQPANKFNSIDAMLKQLEEVSGTSFSPVSSKGKEGKTGNSTVETPGVVSVTPAEPKVVFVERSVEKPIDPLPVESKVGVVTPLVEQPAEAKLAPLPEKNMTRISDLPPQSRFHLLADTFIPAHKQGLLYSGGRLAYAIESGVDTVRLLVERDEDERACMLLSDKSYIMLRGNGDPSRPPSYVDVKSVHFKEWSVGGVPSVLFAEIEFEPKRAREPDGESVNIMLRCRLPATMSGDAKSYALWQINDSMGGLFKFQLPRYIEL